MIPDPFPGHKIILASASPRRRQLLAEMGIRFETCSTETDESYPSNMLPEEIAVFLSKKKSAFFKFQEIESGKIIITADTLVAYESKIIPKPENSHEAFSSLKMLSGKMHYVFTGVTLKSKPKEHSFLAESRVWFRELTEQEINCYIEEFKPYDKAGAYGIQEWIGYIGIERIEGSFFNVMGLPTSLLYSELVKFIRS